MAATPNPTTPKRRRLPRDQRRELILAEAGRLFGERGYEATRLEDVAAAADVTKPILYRHFESKRDLYLALLTRHRDDLPRFAAQAPAAGSRDARLGAILDVWLAYVEEHPYAWRMLFRDTTGDAEIRDFRRSVQERAREVMAATLGAEGVTGAAPELEARAEFLRAGMAGVALWWIDHPDLPREQLLDVLAPLVIASFDAAPRRSAARGGARRT